MLRWGAFRQTKSNAPSFNLYVVIQLQFSLPPGKAFEKATWPKL